MANLKEIAEAAGTSIRTVARVVHGRGYVGGDSRARIEKAIGELGYVPDLDARALRTRRGREVVIISPNTDELQMAKIEAADKVLRGAGFRVHLLFTDADLASAPALFESLTHLKASGVILLPVGKALTTALVSYCQGQQLPVVAIDPPEKVSVSILIDRPRGVEEAVRHLWAQGRRGIAFVGPAEHRSLSRLAGYRKALKELGGMEKHFVVDAQDGEALRRWAQTVKPAWKGDALIAYSDVVALQILQGLHDSHVVVPEEVALVGFDDRRAAALSWPSLSTVAQPNDTIGEAAAALLLKWMEDPLKVPVSQTHPTVLRVRESG